ncbi:hypothetical protein KBX50_25925 [Micromonospora sp. C51]|uniref:hypothetical protein n=1 Tax=Micromonospora sp. C51 TaxID=2824879 RepID=UPI001B381FF5|nr:hypothetical protein [Micromonospora sp. C51]MBQ1051887.1 hypothetical protein [Micromonospora sp. C51]
MISGPDQAGRHQEQLAALDSVASGVKLVALDPGPPVVGDPVGAVPDDPDRDRANELRGRRAAQQEEFPRSDRASAYARAGSAARMRPDGIPTDDAPTDGIPAEDVAAGEVPNPTTMRSRACGVVRHWSPRSVRWSSRPAQVARSRVRQRA